MALETGTFISDLVTTNPTSSDPRAQGDDHLRLIKSTVKATFPNITGAVTPTHTSINRLTAVTGPLVGTTDAQTLTNKTIVGYTEGAVTANTGTAYTVDLSLGTLFILTLNANTTITLPAPSNGKSVMLIVKQDATGGRTVTWAPASIRWPNSTTPTVSANPNRADKFVFTSDGTYWYASNGGQNYTAA